MKLGDLLDGRFRIAEPVGSGGMGAVYRARDERTGGDVAIKVLEGSSPTRLERARREAQVLATLASPAIVAHVADGLTRTGQVYVAMEWIHGATLADRMFADGFTLREAAAVARRLAAALADAHRAGVVHRDIKPTNVILVADSSANPADPAIKLIDFSVAWLVDAAVSLTRSGSATGTPGYMAPEQARGDKLLTPAADLFGLGCVLYECATGRPAFSGTLRSAVLAKVLYAEPPPIATRCPEAPESLVALLARLLAKDPGARPDAESTAAALAALAIPDGPRRTSSAHADQPTAVRSAREERHAVVLAAAGPLEDPRDPPPPEVLEQVARAAGATVEVLVNGALAISLGPCDDARARTCADAVRAALPGWSVVAASARSAGAAIDRATTKLAAAVLDAMFAAPVTPVRVT